jgi:hypothetical protein
LAALTALVALAVPRAGFALALAMPLLPLGNLSLGLALVYAAFAVGWFLFFAKESRFGLLFLLGPAVAPAQAMMLLPALLRNVGGPVRRGLLVAAAVPAAAVVAGLTRDPLPFTGEDAPRSLGIAASSDPGDTLDALVSFLAARPAIWIEAVVLVAAVVTAPYVSRWRYWGVSGWGVAFFTAALLAPMGAVSAFPAALWIAVGTGLLAVPLVGMRR